MSRFQSIHYLVHSAVAFPCYVALTQLNAVDRFIAETPIIQQYPFLKLSVIPLIAILLQQSDRLARLIIGGTPIFSPLLRKTLEGSDHIEGHWPLVVVDADTNKLVFYGFLTISYKDSQLYVAGNDWKPDGTHALWFHSVQSRFRDRLLQYWYEQGQNRTKPTMRGYTEMYFFPRKARFCAKLVSSSIRRIITASTPNAAGSVGSPTVPQKPTPNASRLQKNCGNGSSPNYRAFSNKRSRRTGSELRRL